MSLSLIPCSNPRVDSRRFGEDGAQQLMQQEADRKARQQEEEDAAARGEQVIRMDPHSR